jgi:hypothetical protein
MPASALLAGVVEPSLSNFLPNRVASIQSDGIGRLDFYRPLATTAGDAKHVALNLGATLPHLGTGVAGARVVEYRFPVFWDGPIPSPSRRECFGMASAASFSICFGVGIRQLAGRSVMPN